MNLKLYLKFVAFNNFIVISNSLEEKKKGLTTVVGNYIDKMKTTFDFNIDSHQAVKQHG